MHLVNTEFIEDLTRTMAEHGFRQVSDTCGILDTVLILKRQTWNTNRAIVVVALAQPPVDMRAYLTKLRRGIAFRCGFFPFFWGIGIQVVLVAPGIQQSGIDPSQHVARVDNQWAIIQSVFLADSASQTFRACRTWGQLITGKFQDAMSVIVSRHFGAITQ